MQKRNWIRWLTLFAVWMLIGLSFSVNDYAFKDTLKDYYENLGSFWDMVSWDLIYWPTWLMLVPLIFLIVGRFRLRSKSWYLNGLNVLMIVVAGGFFALLQRIIYLGIYSLIPSPNPAKIGGANAFRFSLLFYNLPFGFMTYFVILLVTSVTDYAINQEAEARKSRLKAESVQAQLHALNMQLQPHFIFNVLNSIAALVHENVNKADEMLARLGNFLRYTLENSGAQIVTLEEELEVLRCYLRIEELRLEERLQVHYELEPQALAARVPNLILQPSVENAIKYGVRQSLDPVQIIVSAKCEGGKLYLQIKDNGEPWQTYKEGIGITNTRARLESVYGSEGHFDLLRTPDGWTAAIFEMPLVTMAESVKTPV